MNNIIVLIPARGGSKRLPRKNIYPVKGKPMILYTVEAALKSKYINSSNLYISTEDVEIKKLAEQNNIKVIERPSELSTDNVWTQDVINHASEVLGLKSEDIIVVLQANSPQITLPVIDKCIEMLIENNLWQVHTVGEDMINNGAIQVMRQKVSAHKGKVNYNGVVVTDWMDIHTYEDVKQVEKMIDAESDTK
jgi:CMP-N-acetylneuraminic acid synthetase